MKRFTLVGMLAVALGLLAGSLLGYLPLPMVAKLDALETKNDNLLAVSQASCGYLAKLAGESPSRCYPVSTIYGKRVGPDFMPAP